VTHDPRYAAHADRSVQQFEGRAEERTRTTPADVDGTVDRVGSDERTRY
jgi:hypothetical protein